jgi:hypothetical protein
MPSSGPNVGKFVWSFQATAEGVGPTVAKLDKLEKGSKKAAAGAEVATRKSRKTSMAFLELSRGAEDAASQIGTTGLSGAFRASANNLSQMASIMSPLAGTIVGLGVAAVAVAPLIIKMFSDPISEAEKLAKELEKIKDLQSTLRTIQVERNVSGERKEDIKSSTNLEEAAKKERKARQDSSLAEKKLSDVVKLRVTTMQRALRRLSREQKIRLGVGLEGVFGVGDKIHTPKERDLRPRLRAIAEKRALKKFESEIVDVGRRSRTTQSTASMNQLLNSRAFKSALAEDKRKTLSEGDLKKEQSARRNLRYRRDEVDVATSVRVKLFKNSQELIKDLQKVAMSFFSTSPGTGGTADRLLNGDEERLKTQARAKILSTEKSVLRNRLSILKRQGDNTTPFGVQAATRGTSGAIKGVLKAIKAQRDAKDPTQTEIKDLERQILEIDKKQNENLKDILKELKGGTI